MSRGLPKFNLFSKCDDTGFCNRLAQVFQVAGPAYLLFESGLCGFCMIPIGNFGLSSHAFLH